MWRMPSTMVMCTRAPEWLLPKFWDRPMEDLIMQSHESWMNWIASSDVVIRMICCFSMFMPPHVSKDVQATHISRASSEEFKESVNGEITLLCSVKYSEPVMVTPILMQSGVEPLNDSGLQSVLRTYSVVTGSAPAAPMVDMLQIIVFLDSTSPSTSGWWQRAQSKWQMVERFLGLLWFRSYRSAGTLRIYWLWWGTPQLHCSQTLFSLLLVLLLWQLQPNYIIVIIKKTHQVTGEQQRTKWDKQF